MYKFFKNAKIILYVIDQGIMEGLMKEEKGKLKEEKCSKCLKRKGNCISDIR